jgi:thiamine biosynthesis lipoprotein
MSHSAPVRRAKPLLGTLVAIEASGHDATRAIAAGFAAIAQVHQRMSRFEADSDIARLNAAPVGAWVEADPATVTVLALAHTLHRDSNGAFDCTRRTDAGHLSPQPAWEIADGRIRKHAPLQFDLGGIAKGYAVDCAIEAMRPFVMDANDTIHALVNAGGDVRHLGEPAINIALRDCNDPAHIAMQWPLHNAAIASSVVGGLTPQAGHSRIFGDTPLPLRAGASVLAPTCILADALTKIILVLRAPDHPLLQRYNARALLYCADTKQ